MISGGTPKRRSAAASVCAFSTQNCKPSLIRLGVTKILRYSRQFFFFSAGRCIASNTSVCFLTFANRIVNDDFEYSCRFENSSMKFLTSARSR